LDCAILLRCSVMRDLAVLFIHLITTIVRLAGPGGLRSVVAESVSGQTATPDPESFPTPFTQSARLRSRRRRLMYSPHAPRVPDPFRNRLETVNSLAPSSSAEEPQVP